MNEKHYTREILTVSGKTKLFTQMSHPHKTMLMLSANSTQNDNKGDLIWDMKTHTDNMSNLQRLYPHVKIAEALKIFFKEVQHHRSLRSIYFCDSHPTCFSSFPPVWSNKNSTYLDHSYQVITKCCNNILACK